jgi:hypothetical protein
MHSLRGTAPSGESGPHVRELRQLTRCYSALSSKAPEVLLPYLNSIADRTLTLVQSGVLGDADKNMIFEGLLVSAAAAGLDMFASVLGALLQQLRGTWSALLSDITGAEWLLDHALGPVTTADGTVSVGGNGQRCRIYYSLQLLVFCARQANALSDDNGGKVGFILVLFHSLYSIYCVLLGLPLVRHAASVTSNNKCIGTLGSHALLCNASVQAD